MKVQAVAFDKIGLTVIGYNHIGTPNGEAIGDSGTTPVGTRRYLTKDGTPYRLKDGSYYIVKQ